MRFDQVQETIYGLAFPIDSNILAQCRVAIDQRRREIDRMLAKVNEVEELFEHALDAYEEQIQHHLPSDRV